MTRRPFHKRLARAFRLAVRELRRPTTRNAFAGAGVSRLLLDWIATSRSADEEIKGDLRKLRARARELARNNSYIKRYLRLLVANVLGHAGIRLQAVVRGRDGALDQETNRKIETAYREFADGPVTVDGRLNLYEVDDLILRTLATDGEAIVRFWRGSDVNPYGLALQLIDSDLLDERFNRAASTTQNEIRLGVEVDTVGRPLAYHFYDKPQSAALVSPASRYRVPAGDVVHIYRADRVNQTRGVTWLHSIMVPVHMLDGYEESEAVASRVSSAKMGFMVQTNPEFGAALSTEGDSGTTPATIQAAPGSFEILDPGYDFKPWDPDHPTSQFSSFITQMVRKIASGLSVFANVLGNDASGVNYSSFRAFSLIERDDYRQTQTDLVTKWRVPLYREFLRSAILTGALRLPTSRAADYYAVRHRARGWSWIDPEKEAKGAVLAIENQLTSRTSILAEKGIDIEDVFAEIKAERELAASYGIELSSSSPVDEPATKSDVEDLAEGRERDGSNGGAGKPRPVEDRRLIAGC